nr:hypothetical protein [Tanacetum cinerariifolium]
MPIQRVERARVIGGALGDLVSAAAAVIGHALDVLAAGAIGLGAEVAAVRVHDHAQRVRQFDPVVGIHVDGQVPLADLPGCYAGQQGEVAGHHEPLDVMGVGVFEALSDGLAHTVHAGLPGPVKLGQRAGVAEGIAFGIVRHLQPVDTVHVEQADIQRRTDARVEQVRLVDGHGVLIITESGQAVIQKILPEGLRVGVSHRVIEAFQRAVMAGKTLADQRQDFVSDGVRGEACGVGRHDFFRQRLAVISVEIPCTTDGGAIVIEQQPLFAPHLAVEEFHAQLGFAAGPGCKFGARAEETTVAVPGDGQATGLDGVFQTPVAAFGGVDFFGVQRRVPALQFTRHRPGVQWIVECDVLHQDAALLKRLGEMAHGTEDQGDFLRVMADMGGFLHDFDHQDGVASGIKVGEGSERAGRAAAFRQRKEPGRGHQLPQLLLITFGQGVHFNGVGLVQTREPAGDVVGNPRKTHEAGVGAQPRIAQCVIPDAPGLLPCMPAEACCDLVERMIGDAGIDVDAAVVIIGVDEVVHGAAGDLVGEQPFADQPAGLPGRLFQGVLLDQRAEHVRHRFVQCAGLVEVDQPGFVLGDAVGEFVADHVEGDGEAVEQRLVAVAKNHLRGVPERVVVALAEMHGGVEGHAGIVDGVAFIDFGEEIEGGAQPVIGFVNGHVAADRLAFAANQSAGQGFAAICGVDRATLAGQRSGGEMNQAPIRLGAQAQ